MMKNSWLFSVVACTLFSCNHKQKIAQTTNKENPVLVHKVLIDSSAIPQTANKNSIIAHSMSTVDSLIYKKFDYNSASLSIVERAMATIGLVDVHDVIPGIQIDLRYASKNNFVGEILNPESTRCFLRIETIIKLIKALQILQQKHPEYTFIIYDGARPQSVQYRMYEIAKSQDKARYVARPEKGGLHNFGIAVDLGLYNTNTEKVVDMGTDFDFFGPEAQPRLHSQMLQEGKLTQLQIDHRNLLRNCMKSVGFISNQSEWWHFEAFNKDYTRVHFQIIK